MTFTKEIAGRMVRSEVAEGVHAEDLHKILERHTGLCTRIPRVLGR